MASNNIILAVPSANSSVNYELPQSESAQLSFSPEDIDGIKLDDQGGLVISFTEGGQVTLTNFQSFIDNGNTLSLADGTNVDPKLLFTALGGQVTPANDSLADVIKIDIPTENAHNEVTLKPGQKYLLNFDLSETTGADVKNGKMEITFANGGKITIANYEQAMASATPAELSLAAKTCVVSGDELITNIQKLAATQVIEETVEEEAAEAKPKSKIAAADMEGNENSGIIDPTGLGYRAGEADVANIEPAAGEADIARELAQIETAAGPGAGGGRAGGYGFNSRPGSEPFLGKPDIGPIDPTALRYRAPELAPSKFLEPTGTPNSIPAVGPDAQFVDETNLKDGNLVVSGSISVNYGNDLPGSISPDGNFTSGGSRTNDQLTSNGDPVTVNVVGNSYVGTTTGGTVVFELVINNDGSYTYTQFAPIDHADVTDPDDRITLEFGVIVRDNNGDTGTTTVTITVADDAPEIEGDEKTIDETDLGPISISDTLVHNFNQDGAGSINATGSFTSGGSLLGGALSSAGQPISVNLVGNTYVGSTAGGTVIFELSINPATGEYTYTQYDNLDHADGSNPNDIITLNFGVEIVDYDGDTETANIIINIKDDAPTFQPPENPPENPPPPFPGNPKPDRGLEIVDETGLKGGSVVETGRLDADFGGDTPGSYAFQNGAFASSGSKTNGQLTHNGVPVVVSLVNGEWVGFAGDKQIFKLELDTATGDYRFTLYDNFDHADKTDPDDQIVLDFAVIASDFDGDSAAGSIRIIVKDDAPIANDDVNTFDTTFGVANGNVITGENGGPGAADNLSTDEFATGPANKVVKIAFEGNEVDVPATGTVSIDGQYGTLTIAADGSYTYEAFPGSGIVTPGGAKEFVSGPALPDFDEGDALDGVEQQSLGVAPGNLTLDGGESVSITFRSEVASYSNTLGVFTVGPDGTLKAETILIRNGNNATAGDTYNYQAGSDAASLGFFLIANGASANSNYSGLNFATGTLNFVYGYGTPEAREAKIDDNGANVKLVFTSQSGVETVLNGPLYFTTDRGSTDNLNADGSVRVVSGIPSDDNEVLRIGFEDLPKLGDKDFNDMVFDVSISKPACGCKDPDIQDQFVYTIEDSDGDRDTATLTLNGQDLTDDKPVLIKPDVEIVDETHLVSGALTETGKVEVDFGHDGPGTINGNGSFTSGGSQLAGQLSSGGTPVTVSFSGNTYTGTAGSVVVFTLAIQNDGSYTYNQFKPLDHADGSNPNDIITLNFGVVATDCDGDKSHTTLTIKVKDDAPLAKDDRNSAEEGQTVTGNVITNDTVGQDTPGTITKVTFGGQEYDLTTGPKTITGQYGSLTINSTGQYSYTANSNNPNGTDRFIYTLKDGDGDASTAKLSIDVTCVNDIPVITPSVKTVDETDLKAGTITQTGNVTADYGSDGPGDVTATGSFTSGGSKLNGQLTSGGQPVTVSLSGNTYTGTANGVTVFTLSIATNGSYTFRLYEQLDHADGSNPNDIITLNFGVIATDADGDTANATITINVKDDAPDAKDDFQSMVNGTSTINGNVMDNDTVGQDTPGSIISISFGGQTKSVPATGTTSIVGQYGTLVIDSTGAYSYTATPGAVGTDRFTYVLKDNDGDTDPAKLTIDVKENPIVVCVFADDICIKEDTSGKVPVHAYVTGGNGNETMTITMTGVPAGWTVTAPGWVKVGNEYTLSLPQGVLDWKGSVTFAPPANSDADLTSLVFKNTVFDPDTNATTFATENAKVIVDAVVDPFKFKATLQEHPSAPDSGKIFVLTKQGTVQHSKISIFNLTRPDADGSESLKSISFTLQKIMAATTHVSVKNPDGTFTQVGTKSMSGVDTVYTIDLSGMSYDQAVNYITKNLYLTNTGKSGLNSSYELGIQIVSYEKNLSGEECDYKDNQTSYTVCVPVNFCISPLVIDLDRDGVELLSKEAGVLFDMTNDGIKDKTGWVASDDALLVLDKNGDGIINDRTELFGNDDIFANGFDNLASYDLNGDGVIDAKDAVFNDLRVWQDLNGDGISQAEEMKSLADVKIAAINLAADEVSYDIAGNPITHESQVIFEDGGSSKVVDAWFEYEGGENGGGVDKGLTLFGTDGNDVISGTTGSDDLYGGLGADTFLFQTISQGVDTLKDFNAAEGDKLDLSNVLTNFDPLTDAINDFVFATETDDGKTILSVNSGGAGEAGAQQLAIIETGNVNVSDLFNNGSIIV